MSNNYSQKQEMPKVSICMMVKNEEEMLPGCLQSVRSLADEIIVVDTGSTDSTVQIAVSFGAKVYHHPWENDFSKHRNQSIDYATGDWFFIIDADERLETADIDFLKLKETLRSLDADIHCLLASVQDYDRDGNIKVTFLSPRLFRTNVGIHYEGIIHNRPVVQGKVIPSDLIVSHYGYDLDPGKMAEKYHRTRTLLLKRIETDAGDYEAHFYLAHIAAIQEDFYEAIEAGKKCLEILPEKAVNVEIYYGMFYIIGYAYFKLNQMKEAQNWFEKGLEKLGKDIDLYFMLTAVGMELKDYTLVCDYARKYLDYIDTCRKQDRFKDLRFIYYLDQRFEDIVRYRFLLATIAEGSLQKRPELIKTVLPYLYSNPYQQKDVIVELIKKNYYDQAAELIIDLHSNADKKIFYIGVVMGLLNEFPEAVQVLELVYHNLGEDEEDQFEMVKTVGTEMIKLGKYEEAAKFYGFAYDIFTGDPIVVSNYALALAKTGNIEKAESVFNYGLEKELNSKDFLMNCIHFFRNIDTEQFEIALTKLLKQISDYEELPDDILLLVLEYLRGKGNVDAILHITEVLMKRANLEVDRELENMEQFSEIFSLLSQYYLNYQKPETALIALDVAYKMNPDLKYIAMKGDIHFNTGNFPESINLYNQLLNNEYFEGDWLKRLKLAFEKVGNAEGSQRCQQLIDQMKG